MTRLTISAAIAALLLAPLAGCMGHDARRGAAADREESASNATNEDRTGDRDYAPDQSQDHPPLGSDTETR